MRLWQIPLDADVAPKTPNRRTHWRVYSDTVLFWRTLTDAAVRNAGVPALERVAIDLAVTPPDRRRRDSDNLVPYLLKPVKDGVVDAGVIPDDTDEFCDWSIHLWPPDGSGRWGYLLQLVEVEPVSRLAQPRRGAA